MGLMYSGNDEHMSRAMLEYVPTPNPRGPRHHPYSFFEYAELVVEELDKIFTVEEEEYIVTKDKMRMFGTIMVTAPVENDVFKLIVGIRGAHDMKIPRGICGGERVIVCSNLMFGGELVNFKTKQTLNIENRIKDFVSASMENLESFYGSAERRMHDMQEYQVDAAYGDHLLADMYRRGGLSAAQLAVALNEWEEPSYEQHAEWGRSAWRLLNAGTQALKPRGENSNPFTVQNRSRIIDDVVYNVVKGD